MLNIITMTWRDRDGDALFNDACLINIVHIDFIKYKFMWVSLN